MTAVHTLKPVLNPDQAAFRKRTPKGSRASFDQLRVELVQQVARIGDFQVAAVGLEQVLERGFGGILGHAGRRHDIAEGGAAAQSAKCGKESGVGLGGGYRGYVRQGLRSLAFKGFGGFFN